MEVESISDPLAIVGEGPLWHPTEHRLYWVDIIGKRMFRYDSGPDRVEDFALDRASPVTALASLEPTSIVLASNFGLEVWSPGDEWAVAATLDLPGGTRSNDGKCDPNGRFWLGTMAVDGLSPIGELYTFGDLRSPRLVLDSLTLSNGLGWSPDGSVFYLIDSIQKCVFRAGMDPDRGSIGKPDVFIDLSRLEAMPDGLAVDSEGRIWIAMFNGWCIRVYDAEGTVVELVELPVQKPTSLAFGGDQLRDLYVTTARRRLTDEQLESQPLAGALLRLRPGVSGQPVSALSGL